MEEPAAIHARARKLVNCIEFQLQQMEQQEVDTVAPGALALDDDSMRRHALTENLNRLSGESALLEKSVQDTYGGVAAASAKSDIWRKRAQHMQAETAALRATVMKYLHASFQDDQLRKDRQNRQRLLQNASGAQAVAVDSLLAERASISASASMVDDYTALAGNVMTSLKAQRGTLKSAHRKVLDVAATLGLSSTLIRMIERRTTADKIAVYGGMVLLALLLAIAYWWLRT